MILDALKVWLIIVFQGKVGSSALGSVGIFCQLFIDLVDPLRDMAESVVESLVTVIFVRQMTS